MNVVSLSQNILLSYTLPSCDGMRWYKAYITRWSKVNGVGSVAGLRLLNTRVT
jgi:hypothetical protein